MRSTTIATNAERWQTTNCKAIWDVLKRPVNPVKRFTGRLSLGLCIATGNHAVEMFPISDFKSGVTMWMINVFLRVLFINVWLIVLAILILKIPALNTTYNIIMLIVLTVYYGTIFSFYALSLNYSVY